MKRIQPYFLFQGFNLFPLFSQGFSPNDVGMCQSVKSIAGVLWDRPPPNNRWVWDKEAQCVGLDREALGFFSPYQMCFRHSFVYSCFWVGKRRHLLNLLIRLKYFKSLYTLHTTHRILGAPNFYYNSNLVLVNPTGSWHCQFLPVLKGWKILINSHVPGSDSTEICVKVFVVWLK